MWDYDKLFTDGNIVGVKNCYENFIYNQIIDPSENNYWVDCYQNNELSCKEQFVINDKNGSEYTTDFEIQYIIRLDEHGNVVEKLFDREKDIPKPMPEFETGMFVLIFNYNHTETRLGYINAERNMVIYQTGGWDYIDENKDKILKVYSDSCNCFDGCCEQRVIWRNPEYQDYLDYKK